MADDTRKKTKNGQAAYNFFSFEKNVENIIFKSFKEKIKFSHQQIILIKLIHHIHCCDTINHLLHNNLHSRLTKPDWSTLEIFFVDNTNMEC